MQARALHPRWRPVPPTPALPPLATRTARGVLSVFPVGARPVPIVGPVGRGSGLRPLLCCCCLLDGPRFGSVRNGHVSPEDATGQVAGPAHYDKLARNDLVQVGVERAVQLPVLVRVMVSPAKPALSGFAEPEHPEQQAAQQ